MKIIIEKSNETKNIDINQIKVDDLLKKLNINPVTVIVTKKGNALTDNSILKNKDIIRIISVVSGG